MMVKRRVKDAVWKHDAPFREVAALVVLLASLLGILGLYISSLAAVWTYGDLRRGEISASDFAASLTIWLMLTLCPLLGWIALARGKARLAIVAASPLLLAAIVGLVVTTLGG